MTTTKTYTPGDRGIMLNGTSVMDAISKVGERALLLGYVMDRKITHIDMYGVSGVLQNKSNWAGLASLIKDLRSAGVRFVSAQRGSAYKHLNDVNISTVVYNAWNDDVNCRFNVFGLEGEPWQTDHTKEGYVPYAEWMDSLKQLYTYSKEAKLLNLVYVHDLLDTTTNTTPQQIAADLVANAQIILLTCYMPMSKITSKSSLYKRVMNRLNLIADAAKQKGLVQCVYLLINSKNNTEGSGAYLATGSADDIYNIVVRDSKTMVNKIGSLQLRAVDVYGWQELKAMMPK